MSERDHRLLWRHDGLHCNIVAKRRISLLCSIHPRTELAHGPFGSFAILTTMYLISCYTYIAGGSQMSASFLPDPWPCNAACALRPYIAIAFSAIYIAGIRVGVHE